MKPWPLLVLILGASVLPGPAEAPAHWAFQPIRDPAPPRVSRAAWCRTSVDRFILQRLEAAGLTPAAPADRRTLIRRASFDLTGLPPTAEDVEAFASDPSPRAWEHLVDRLLESPRYGEHWGRHWLDVVRYADTAGETADYPVPAAWRYRNYVIDAFNADKPYDEFLREQVAGDILARRGPREKYAERVTATGYLAISRRFGFDSENYHHLTLQDTIDNLGQAVLGLTLGCARCHEHKYDPVSMPDYYALYGIFESTRYPFPGSEQKQKHRALAPLLPPAESQVLLRTFEARVADLTARVARGKLPVPSAVLRSLDDLDGDFELQAPAAGGSKGVLVPPWIYDGPIAVTTDAQSPFANLHPAGRVGAAIAAGDRPYHLAQALHPARPRGSPGLLHVNLDFRVASNPPAASGIHRFWLGSRPAGPAVEVLLAAGTLALRTGSAGSSFHPVPTGTWLNLQLTLDLRAGTVSGRLGRPEALTELPPRPLAPDWPGTLDFVALESAAPPGLAVPDIAFDNLGLETEPIPAVTVPRPSAAPPAGDPAALAADAAQAKRELETLLADGPFPMAYAVSEGTPGNARLQRRGDPDRPGEIIPRGLLPALGGGPLPPGTPGSGRMELADWLASPTNPLTARVMVNRIWQYHFGQGLVKTPNDFGTRGRPPTHPDLLDHLATEFIHAGWSIKAMHRLLLASAVYQQQSRTSDPAAAASTAPPAAGPDADCPALPQAGTPPARPPAEVVDTDTFTPFPRRRLGAEETRDAILFVAAELDPTPGQGHPFPTPTGWGYTQHGPFGAVYEHRHRSVYLMTQRLRRHPFLALFDGADPNASTPERRTTIVPTQALFFLNDPFVHACATTFARRLLDAAPDESRRIETAYRLALARRPTEAERAEAAAFLEAYRAESGAADHAAARIETLAAFARVLFGSNEFLVVD